MSGGKTRTHIHICRRCGAETLVDGYELKRKIFCSVTCYWISKKGPKGDWLDRFRSYVNVPLDPDACHLWTGPLDGSDGYGIMFINGKNLRAHRVSYELGSGEPIPDGLVVCHHCDVRPCVRFDHLFLGTPGDNVRDMIAKGRGWNQTKVQSQPLELVA